MSSNSQKLNIPQLKILNRNISINLDEFYNSDFKEVNVSIKIYYNNTKDLEIFKNIFLKYCQQKINFDVKEVPFLKFDDLKINLAKFHKEFIFILISKKFMNFKNEIHKLIYSNENNFQYLLIDIDNFNEFNSNCKLFSYLYILLIKQKINVFSTEDQMDIMEIAFYKKRKNNYSNIYCASTYCDNKFLFYTQTIQRIENKNYYYLITFKALCCYFQNTHKKPKKIFIYLNDINEWTMIEKTIQFWNTIVQKDEKVQIEIQLVGYYIETNFSKMEDFGKFIEKKTKYNGIEIDINTFKCKISFDSKAPLKKDDIQFLFNSSLKSIFHLPDNNYPYAIYNVIEYQKFLDELNLNNDFNYKDSLLPFYLLG